MQNTLLLIDGHNFLFKSYSVPFKFRSPSGTPLHVTSTFLNLLKKSINIVEKETGQCTHILVAFDCQGSTDKNKSIYADYKANRKHDYSLEEDSPFEHLVLIKKVLEASGILYYEDPQYEADDFIGTFAKDFVNQNNSKVVIASTDTDFYQLVNERVNLLKLGREGVYDVITNKYIYDQLQITPEQYVLYKSMVGDPSDNIPGIPKIGKIRASKILNNTFPFNLEEYSELLQRNKELISINCEVAYKLKWELHKVLKDKIYINNQNIFDSCGF
jgi:DNA polymerase I